MNQKRTRVPLPHPPPRRQSWISFWLTVLVGLLLMFAIGASLYMIVESLITGSITTNNRGPRKTWLRDLQPHKYWFEVIWQSLGTLFLLAVSLFGLRVYLKVRKSS